MSSNVHEIAGELARVCGEFKTRSDSIAKTERELDQRLHELEQRMANIRGDFAGSPNPSALRSAIEAKLIPAIEQVRGRGVSTGMVDLGLELRSLVNIGNGDSDATPWPSQPQRLGGLFGYGARPLRLLEALQPMPVEAAKLTAIQLQNFTPAADVQATEGAEKARQALDPQEVEFPVATIATWLPVSDQLLADVRELGQMLVELLSHTVLAKAERQCIYGTGASGEMRGFWGDAQLYAALPGDPQDQIGDAAAALDANGYNADLIVLHPNDWRAIQAQRADNGTGAYLMQSPAQPIPPSLWNARVVSTPAINAGDALVLDSRFTRLLDRRQASAGLFAQDGDNVRRNLQTLRVEGRWGVALLDTGAALKLSIGGTSSE